MATAKETTPILQKQTRLAKTEDIFDNLITSPYFFCLRRFKFGCVYSKMVLSLVVIIIVIVHFATAAAAFSFLLLLLKLLHYLYTCHMFTRNGPIDFVVCCSAPQANPSVCISFSPPSLSLPPSHTHLLCICHLFALDFI